MRLSRNQDIAAQAKLSKRSYNKISKNAEVESEKLNVPYQSINLAAKTWNSSTCPYKSNTLLWRIIVLTATFYRRFASLVFAEVFQNLTFFSALISGWVLNIYLVIATLVFVLVIIVHLVGVLGRPNLIWVFCSYITWYEGEMTE